MNVLITGASKGIGYELVKQFALDQETKVIAIARDLSKLEELQSFCKKELDNLIQIYSIDFLSTNLDKELEKILSENNDHFDIIINNAGYLINQSFQNTSIEDVQQIFQVNLYAPIQLIKSCLPYLNKNKQCHIVNIGSMGGYQGSVKFPGLSAYSASKSALANLTECLAEEYKEENIKINCLALGSVQTEMLNEAFPGFIAQTSAKEMAKYIFQFSMIGAKYHNGKIIPVSITTP